MSIIGEMAVEDALANGKAILKFISKNELGMTGSHQSGFYLPKAAWQLFAQRGPQPDENHEHTVAVRWPDGLTTISKVKWYGKGTRSEYRLTGFGRGFPWRTEDSLGSLLVLIPVDYNNFHAYVLDTDDDIQEIQFALGVEVIESWVTYERGLVQPETEDSCINRHFRAFAAEIEIFPAVQVFSNTTLTAILDCVKGFSLTSSDEQLLRLIREEYVLFRMVERKVHQREVQRLFDSIDDFIDTALSILNARKSRAGRSLENHVEYLLQQAGIPYEMRQVVDKTRPDIIMPSKAAYDDPSFPQTELFMLAVKTTCKDRWRQVTREAPRIRQKYILTLQEGISSKQLDEMHEAEVRLVVPEPLHNTYPESHAGELIQLQSFLESLRAIYSQ